MISQLFPPKYYAHCSTTGGGQFLSPAANMTFKGWKAVIDTNVSNYVGSLLKLF